MYSLVVNDETNLLKLITPYLDNNCQIKPKRATATFSRTKHTSAASVREELLEKGVISHREVTYSVWISWATSPASPRHQNYYEFSHPKHAILVGMSLISYRSYRNPNQRVCRILHETGSKNSKPRLVGVFAKLESEAFTNRACQDKDFHVRMVTIHLSPLG